MAATPRRRMRALAAVCTGVAAALLAAEGAVRVLCDEPVQPRFVVDSGFGVRANEAGVRTRHYVPGEYDVALTTNSAGMRGSREYSLERVPKKCRLVVLGDSFAFGYGVEDREVVSAVLEELLEARGGGEVLNFAVSGFGQAEELLTWRERARAYRPDVVVLFYFENDVGNNAVSRLFTLDPQGLPVRAASEYLPGSRLQEALFAFPPTRWLFEHSQAWNLLRRRLSARVQREALEANGLDTFRDTTPEAVALTRALLTLFVAEVRAAGARPILFVVPDGATLSSNFPLQASELSALGGNVLDGREFLSSADYYPRDSHWRASGHRKAAERLAAIVETLRP